MKVINTAIPDVLLFEPKVFNDERGFFFESFNQKEFSELTGCRSEFVQDNHSKSTKNVLRGLHFQRGNYAQGKLIRCVAGEVYDVAVDIRKGSPTFGQWTGVILSAENKKQLWIPEGFAHGFLTLSETAEIVYKASGYYAPSAEGSILWCDEALNIAWPLSGAPILSPKDAAAPELNFASLYEN